MVIDFAAKKASGMVSFVEEETKCKLKKLQECMENPEDADQKAGRMMSRITEFE